MWRLLAIVVLVQCAGAPGPPAPAVVISSATPSASLTTAPPSWPVVTPAILGGPNCRPPSALVTLLSGGGPRPLFGTPGVGTDTRAVLAFFLVPMAGVEQKMILRMNGTGAPAIHAEHDPIFPGTNEYGVLMTFPKSGCWQVHVQRAGASADFYLIVG